MLIAIIGLGLFAFIAEEFFRSLETTSNVNKQQVGKVYGEKLNVQDFQAMVEEVSEVAKIQKQMNGQSDALSDQEQDQIRATVWQSYVKNKVIEHETEKIGLVVTDAEEQEALRAGSARSLQIIAPFFGDQTGRLNIAALQDFLKRKDQMLAQAAQQNPEQAQQIQRIYGIWQYAEKRLREELLEQKFYIFLQQSFIGNAVTAKMDFDDRVNQSTAEVAAVPYSTIADKDVKLTDADLQKAYDALKEYFYAPTETRDIKFIDVAVTASPADKAALNKDMNEYYTELQTGGNYASIVAKSKSSFAYSNLPMSKKAFQSMPDVAAALDSMAVGATKAPYYTASDNTMTTLKLIGKVQAPDSVLVRQIFAPAQTKEASKVLADSIYKALDGGADFATIAKKYQQQGDSAWITSAQYEAPGLSEDNVKMISALYTLAPGAKQIVEMSQGSLVVQVLDRKAMTTKYNVAVVKRSVDFSKQTYNAELNKLNRFLSQNKTVADIEKNAAKSGYILRTQDAFATTDESLQQQIGGMKDVVRWIFDEADKGAISRLYEVGRNNDHLFVVAVTGVNEKGYLPKDNANVKQTVQAYAMQQKKAELLAERLKNVTSIAAAKQQKDVLVQSLSGVSFSGYPAVEGINVPEPVLAAAIAKTAAGKFVAVKGAAAYYMVQVTGKSKTDEKFDKTQEMAQQAQREFGSVLSQSYYGASEVLINTLMRDADVVDNRYKF